MRKCIAQKSRGDENDFMLALERGNGAEILGGRSTFVWQPGGVANPSKGVYTTWASLAPVLAVTRGQKSVTVNTTSGAAHITAGAWPSITDITFIGGETSPFPTVTVDDGATFTSTRVLTLDSILFSYAGTTVPFISASATGNEFNLHNGGTVVQTGGQPFLALTGTGAAISFVDNGSAWTDGTLTVAAAATCEVFCFDGGGITAAAASGAGTFALFLDGSSQAIAFPQTGVTTQTFQTLDPQPTFVFKPGSTGVQDGNVFTTWASLAAAVALTAGFKVIAIDNSLGNCHMTAGAWAGFDMVEFVSLLPGTTNADRTLTIDDGATFSPCPRFLWFNNVFVQNNQATAPVVTTDATGISLRIYRGILQSSGSQPFLSFAVSGSVGVSVEQNGSINTGTTPSLAVALGLTQTVRVRDTGTLQASTVTGAGNLTINASDQSTVSATQPGVTGTITLTFSGKASQLAYTPTTAGNWNPVPTLTSAALDQLAASNTVTATGNTGTGTGTVTVTTGNITKAKNGKMIVRASCVFSSSAAATITAQLVRDAATNIGTAKSVVAAAAVNAMDFFIEAIDTAPDNNAHTYKLSLTASAGNLTVAANSAQISVVEDS